MDGRILDYFALFMLTVVSITMVYAIIYIHDIPYEIAKKRRHPHQDAIHTAGWVSLFLLHTIWPFLWIWATLYKPGMGWGMGGAAPVAAEQEEESQAAIVKSLEERVALLEKQLEDEKPGPVDSIAKEEV
ncbi:MAG: DUF3302 domain-containing protein [Thermodesulfobacteriota bacterium]